MFYSLFLSTALILATITNEGNGMEISERIKTLRKEVGFSQEELTDRIGVSRQAITKWETGAGLPDLFNIKALAEEFDTSIDNLVYGSAEAAQLEDELNTSCMYDITESKVFDISVGACRNLIVREALDGKVEVRTNLPNTSISIDEHKGLIDINFKKKDNVSDSDCKENLDIEILLPAGLVRQLEVDVLCSSVRLLDVEAKQMEVGGKFGRIELDGNRGHIEIDCNLDLQIVVGSIDGLIDVNQWKATSVLLLNTDTPIAVVCANNRCTVSVADSAQSQIIDYVKNESKNVIAFYGYRSELKIIKPSDILP